MTKSFRGAVQNIGGSSAESQLTPAQQLEAQELEESPALTLTEKCSLCALAVGLLIFLSHVFLGWPG